MRTALNYLDIALLIIFVGMFLLHLFLFSTKVGPTIKKRDLNYWVYILAQPGKRILTPVYLQQLTPQQKAQWENRFLANASIFVGIPGTAFALLLLLLNMDDKYHWF